MASAQTSSETRKPLDFYPTPEWYTKALIIHTPLLLPDTVLCPYVGNGAVAKQIQRLTGIKPITNDVEYYGFPLDFNLDLSIPLNYKKLPIVDWVIDNPPYGLISDIEHIKSLHSLAKKGLALLLRQTWYSAGTGKSGVSKRGEWLADHPATMRITLPRYPFANNTKTGKPQTDACAHEWVIWSKTDWKPTIANLVVTSKQIKGWEWRNT